VTVTQRWDLATGALYLRLAEGQAARTAEISDDVNVDLDGHGRVLGIELLAPGQPWPLLRIFRDYPVAEADQYALIAGYPFVPCSVEVARSP
jgi:uncharacterized protein YuzE